MRNPYAPGVLIMILILGGFAIKPVGAAEDEPIVVANRIIGNLMNAWQSADGKAYAAEFWPDAEFINVFGGIMKDQLEIASRTDFIMKGPLKGRKAVMTIRKVRMLAPNVILVDTMDTDPAGATTA